MFNGKELNLTELRSPAVGKVLRMSVAPGVEIERGQELMVIESMKVEIPIKANASGRVTEVHVKVGDHVQRNRVLVRVEA
ncbi:MAG: acetyl-CoA carboxylase biotin carboxyl carrier protein subunit [Candidatus Binataceae bacterium]